MEQQQSRKVDGIFETSGDGLISNGAKIFCQHSPHPGASFAEYCLLRGAVSGVLRSRPDDYVFVIVISFIPLITNDNCQYLLFGVY